MDEVFARVGEDSRRNGRVPVSKLIENLDKERSQLGQRKIQLQYELNKIEDWRRQETSQILMRRLPKTRSIEETTRLETEAREKKAPFVKEIQHIEKRLHDIKGRLKDKQSARTQLREDVAVLLRIESLLAKILNRLPESKN